MQVLGTTFGIRINAAYWVRVAYMQGICATFRMPIYLFDECLFVN